MRLARYSNSFGRKALSPGLQCTRDRWQREAGRSQSTHADGAARRVRSGDRDNLEVQAARKHCPALMGADFPRDLNAGGATAQLNHRCTVVRSCVPGAIIGAGQPPVIGLHHQKSDKRFALADDRVELFRPRVDRLVGG